MLTLQHLQHHFDDVLVRCITSLEEINQSIEDEHGGRMTNILDETKSKVLTNAPWIPGMPGTPRSPWSPRGPGNPGGPRSPGLPGSPVGPLCPGSPLIPCCDNRSHFYFFIFLKEQIDVHLKNYVLEEEKRNS